MQELVTGRKLMMQSARLVVFLLVFSLMDSVLAEQDSSDLLAAYRSLERQEFGQVERLYAEAIQRSSVNPGSNEAELFFRNLRWGSGGAGGNTPQAAAAWNLALQWVQASPTSVPAARFLGQLAVRDAVSNTDWSAQERQVNDAIVALERVKSAGHKDPMWHSVYVALKAMNGATPEQTLAHIRAHLPSMAEPGEVFFQEVVAAFDLQSTDALFQLKELAELAVKRTSGTRGTGMHAVIYLAAFRFAPALRLRPFSPAITDWRTMDKALLDLERHRPDNLIRVQHAALACLAQDRSRAVGLLTRLGEPNSIDSAVWSFWGGESFYQRCKTWGYGRSAPA